MTAFFRSLACFLPLSLTLPIVQWLSHVATFSHFDGLWFVCLFLSCNFLFFAMCNMDLFILLTSKQHRKHVTTRASSSKSFAQTSFSCTVAAAAADDGFYRSLAPQFSLFSDCIRFVLSTLNAYMRAYYYTTAPELLILSSYMHSITYTHAQTMD